MNRGAEFVLYPRSPDEALVYEPRRAPVGPAPNATCACAGQAVEEVVKVWREGVWREQTVLRCLAKCRAPVTLADVVMDPQPAPPVAPPSAPKPWLSGYSWVPEQRMREAAELVLNGASEEEVAKRLNVPVKVVKVAASREARKRGVVRPEQPPVLAPSPPQKITPPEPVAEKGERAVRSKPPPSGFQVPRSPAPPRPAPPKRRERPAARVRKPATPRKRVLTDDIAAEVARLMDEEGFTKVQACRRVNANPGSGAYLAKRGRIVREERAKAAGLPPPIRPKLVAAPRPKFDNDALRAIGKRILDGDLTWDGAQSEYKIGGSTVTLALRLERERRREAGEEIPNIQARANKQIAQARYGHTKEAS